MKLHSATRTDRGLASVAVCDDGSVVVRRRDVELSGVPDHDAARAWRRSLKRVDRVVIVASDLGWSAELVGVGHRVPIRRRISSPTAFGLAAAGVPVVVESGATG